MLDAYSKIKKPNFIKRLFGRPESLLLISFISIIALGAFLLSLPVSQVGEDISFIDAFFTSVSAVCVTGLITVDTATAWSMFGQGVILALIQVGGLGIMSFAALIFRIIRMKMSYRSRVVIEDSFFQQNIASEFRSLLKQILLLTFFLEGIGFILLYFLLPGGGSGVFRIFNALFHSISAFCNAGFSLYSDSLLRFAGNFAVVIVFIALIILGGLGFAVLVEIRHRMKRSSRRKPGRLNWSLHTRVVLWSSLFLIVVGSLFLYFDGLTPGDESTSDQALGSLFQSVTARTAGFNTVDISALKPLSLLLLMLLMFIGGAPGSCAGGVKTTTMVSVLSHLWTGLKGISDVNIMERRIPNDVIRRAIVVVTLAVFWNVLGFIVLSFTEGLGVGDGILGHMFEQISAFGTVGLSTGITSGLSAAGKLWIILTMFVGRLGPLTIALMLVEPESAKVRYPKERLMIG